MGQVLHGCVTTTEAIRRAIQNSQESLRARYRINPKTVSNSGWGVKRAWAKAEIRFATATCRLVDCRSCHVDAVCRTRYAIAPRVNCAAIRNLRPL